MGGNLSRDQAMAAAVHLQRNVGLMQKNLDVLDQYTLSLQGTASKLIELCLGALDFPAVGRSWSSCPPRFRAYGGDGAVAALVGSVKASLVSRTLLDLFHLGLKLYIYVFGFYSC